MLISESRATIVRIRGMLSFYLDLSTAAGDGFNGAFGMGIISADAFGAGSAAFPGPFFDADWPGWIVHRYWHLHGIAAQSQGADVPVNAFADVQHLELDSKAMRKQGANEILFGMVETAVETGTAGMRFVADTRILDKLS